MTAVARRLWRRRLDFLLAEEAVLASPAQRFELQQQIAECRAKLADLDRLDAQHRPPDGTVAIAAAQDAGGPGLQGDEAASGSAGILPARRLTASCRYGRRVPELKDADARLNPTCQGGRSL